MPGKCINPLPRSSSEHAHVIGLCNLFSYKDFYIFGNTHLVPLEASLLCAKYLELAVLWVIWFPAGD